VGVDRHLGEYTAVGFPNGVAGRPIPPALHDHVAVLRRVDPDPPKGSSTMSRVLLELRIARSTSATGFIVGCRSFLAGLSMNHTSP
jgi:hypothetical protein